MYNKIINNLIMLSDSEEEKTMYEVYLECLEHVNYIDCAKERIQMLKGDIDPTQEEIKLSVLNIFLEQNDDDTCEIETCDLLEFPLEVKAMIVEKFLDFGNYSVESSRQVCKLIYSLWPKYMNDGNLKDQSDIHMSIYKTFDEIRTKLYDFKDINTIKEYREFTKNTDSGCGYLHCHLLAFLPLIGEYGIKTIMKVITFPYEDAQDGMMFGISQCDPKTFLPVYREILKFFHSWYEADYENEIGVSNYLHIESGTGMTGDINRINKEYFRKGVNVYEDQEISKIFSWKYNKKYFNVSFLKDDLPPELGIAKFNFD